MAVRSPITQAILAQSLQPFPNQVFSAGEGAARAASKILSAVIAKKLMKQEDADRAEGIESVVASVFPQPQVTVNQAPSAVPGATVDAGQLDQFQNVRPVVQNLLSSDNPQLQAIGGNMIAQMLSDRVSPAGPQVRPANEDERVSFLGPENAQNPNIGLEVKLNERGQPVDFQVADLREKPGTTITFEDKQEGAFRSTFGKKEAEAIINQFETFNEEGALARNNLTRLEQLESLIGTGVQTGKIQALTLPIKQFFKDLGFEFSDELPVQEAIQSLTKDFTLDKLQKLSGAKSDFEFQQVEQIVPGLSKTPEGNLLLIELTRKTMQAQIAANEAAQAYRDEIRSDPSSFRQAELQKRVDNAVQAVVNDDFLNQWLEAAKGVNTSPREPSTSPSEGDIVFGFDENGNLVRK